MKVRLLQLISLAGLFALTLPNVAETAQGTVFIDANNNGIHDSGESPVAGVRVSNGVDIAVTNQLGHYELMIDGDTIVFVTKPAGYGLPVNGDQIPQFYYIHRPQGSPPNLRYPGVEPTGPLPDTIDFPLLSQEEPNHFDVVLMADPQPQTEVELSFIRDDVVAELIGTDARFGMTMGDLMFDDLSLFKRYNRLIGRIGIPWFNVPGNHELNFGVSSDAESLETYTRHYGPPYYSFEYANVVFIVLDNVFYEGSVQPTREYPRGRGSYVGRIDERQLAWLTHEISHVPSSKLVFLAMHVPLMSSNGPVARIHTDNAVAVLDLLDDHPHVYSVAGHMHAAEHVYLDSTGNMSEGGRFHHHILSTVSGSWWSGPFDDRGIPTAVQSDGTPNGYHILTVDDVSPSVRLKAASLDPNFQMRISFDRAFHSDTFNGLRDFRPGELFDGRMTEAQTAGTRVYVNLFDGGPKSTVAFRVNGGDSMPMVRVPGRDPTFLELLNRYADVMKSWAEPYPSQHLWVAPLPQLDAGAYTLAVEGIDEFSRTHKSFRILEITTE